RQFDITSDCAVRTGFYRSNLTLDTTVVTAKQRDQALLDSIQNNPPGSAIVYVTLQKTAEQVAQQLAKAGLAARAYHAGLKTELRNEVQEWFMTSDHAIVVATIAFGMGVDKADIRAVYHYNLPKSLENYSQEIGRAGRDDQPSLCLMLVCPDDLNVLENFIYGDTPDEQSIIDLIGGLFSLADAGEEFDVSLYTLSSEYDIRALVLRTLLTYLELDGYLLGGTPFYADYSFKPLQSSGQILQRFEGERREFLSKLFRQAVKGRTWFKLDLAQATSNLGTSRERIITALDWLAEQQLLEVKVAGIRHRYRIQRKPESSESLATELHQRMIKREQAEISRLQQVLDLVSLDNCQTNALAAHFGEQRSLPCGHCHWCNKGVSQINSRKTQNIDEILWRQVEVLIQEEIILQTNPRLLTRLLCGVSSPRLSRKKLTGHSLFGSLQHIPFTQILSRVEQLLS
ncbi:MAG: C-terminal helicase domain-containing protein, partial [Gammaproteobacteria bacterium]|nr:C-terminal helicase domain-containing protein [Gammaproteobacteria bacterium]